MLILNARVFFNIFFIFFVLYYKKGKSRYCVKTLHPTGARRVITKFLVFPVSTGIDITIY